MPIDPSVLLYGLQPQARTPYDAPDVVAERRAHVEQLREQAKAKQQKEYEAQVYDWAIKSNLGPDGQPDFPAVAKALYGVSAPMGDHFMTTWRAAQKETAAEKTAALNQRKTGLEVFSHVASTGTAENWPVVYPILKNLDPELSAQLTDQFDQDKLQNVLKAGLSTNELLTQNRDALKLYADGKVQEGMAKQFSALPRPLKDADVADVIQNARDHGAGVEDVRPFLNMPTDQIPAYSDRLLKGPTTLAAEADRAATRQDTQDRDAATTAYRADQGLRADQAAKATADYRAEQLKLRQARANQPVGGAGAGAAGGLTPDAVDYVATQYRILGPSGMPTRISEADRTAVLNKSAEQVKLLGQSPAIAVQRQAAYKSDATSLTKMRSMAAAAESFETKANQQADIVNELSGKVGRTGSPMLNSWLLAGKKEVAGDTDTALLYNAIQTFSTEYAKIMEGSTGSAAGSSDSARKASENLIKAAMAPATIPKVVSLMQREMALTRTGYDATIEHITNRMGGTVPPEAGGGAPTTKMLRFGNNAPFQVTKQPDGTWKSDSGGIYDDRGTRIK